MEQQPQQELVVSSDEDDHSSSSQESLQSSSHPLLEDEGSNKVLLSHSSATEFCRSKVKQYEDCDWEDLPHKVQQAAARLGYTEQMWNHENHPRGEEPESAKKYWVQLNIEEKEAAKVLGYNEVYWDFGDKEVITPEDYDDMYWNQLPKHIRKAYRVLGYRKSVWNEDEYPASFDKDWFELTKAEQRAATIVGYTPETWDDDPEDDKHESILESTTYFFKGSCYILLECLSMSAFLGVIKAFFSYFGKRFLNGHALGGVKIFTGLVIMFFSGQTRKWLEDEEESCSSSSNRITSRNQNKGDQHEIPLFRSFLNLFSWWAIFAGVDHFMDAFENDILYNYSDSAWYLKLCEEPENATLLLNATNNATQVANTTFSMLKGRIHNFTDMVEDFIIDNACEVLDDDQERMGPVYYSTVFIGSAMILWYAFEDNFLKGCDVD